VEAPDPFPETGSERREVSSRAEHYHHTLKKLSPQTMLFNPTDVFTHNSEKLQIPEIFYNMYKAVPKISFFLLIVALLVHPCYGSDDVESMLDFVREGSSFGPCISNSKISAWCDSLKNDVECTMDLARDMYMCQCLEDHSSCPEECIAWNEVATEPIKTRHSILCHGAPRDEPNYILKTNTNLPLHHCENNGVVANWCNEATNPGLDCLLLPALDEYVCTCRENAITCPTECIEGSSLGRKTRHAVRCRGIPVDSPNYVLD
jgi:hypothetical protein